jgi:hypothetical protein
MLPKRVALSHYHHDYFNVEREDTLHELMDSKGYKRVEKNSHTFFYEL